MYSLVHGLYGLDQLIGPRMECLEKCTDFCAIKSILTRPMQIRFREEFWQKSGQVLFAKLIWGTRESFSTGFTGVMYRSACVIVDTLVLHLEDLLRGT